MSVTAHMYGQYPLNAAKKLISDLSAAGTAVKLALLDSSVAPDQDADEAWTDITSEITGTGYTAGGATLSTKTVTYASRVTTFDADDVSWTSSTITARYAVLYDSTGGKLILWVDFGEDKSSSNGTFKVEWASTGIFAETVAA